MVRKQHQGIRFQAFADQRQFLQRLPARQWRHANLVAAQRQARHQQFQFVALPRQRGQQHSATTWHAGKLQTGKYPATQKLVEEQPLAGLPKGALAGRQVVPNRHEHLGEHLVQGIGGKYLIEQAAQAGRIKALYGLACLVLPAQPGIRRAAGLNGKGMAARKDAAHLADCHTALQPAEDTADVIDVGLGVQAVTAVGAGWLNQPVAALPGTQGHGIDARQPGHFPDRKQLHAAQDPHRSTGYVPVRSSARCTLSAEVERVVYYASTGRRVQPFAGGHLPKIAHAR